MQLFINSDSTNFSEASASHGSLPACEPNLWNIATTPFLLSPTSLPSLPKQTDKRFLDYYYQAMCPLTTVGSSSKSPFASILLPFSLVESSNVFHAILALAACHCSKTSNLFRADAMRLKDSVLRSLRKRILSQSSTQVVQDPEILLTMMFMCLYEIVDNCDKMWTVHLRGARDVIRLRRHQTTSSVARANSDPVLCFADRFFAFQDIIGRTACGERQLFGNEYWKAEDDEIDAWMGCSQALARILCTITELSLQKQREILHVVESTEPSFAIRAAELENQLAGLKQSSKTGDRLLEKAAELKRLAAEVYLHCILYDATPSTALIATYVRKILRGISDFLEMGCLAGLTWPLFVAAVELDPINDDLWTELEPGDCIYGRPLVLRALDAMASSTMANVPRTRSVVERVWHARDLDQIADSGQRRTSQHRNDWEAFVAPFSEHMSLT
ncbi:MAG: hypothetical protein M1819_001794 [Sarea resinae]|nr:MAG: hypothetical protein M1819_001794 [Sarea resinae]